MRTTSAPAASPRPTWTTGDVMSCFWTCSPERTSISPPMPKLIDALIAGRRRRARPDRLRAVRFRGAAGATRGLSVRREADHLEPAVAVQISTACTPSPSGAGSATKAAPGPASSTRVVAGPDTIRSLAPLLSRSAVNRRAVAGRKSRGRSHPRDSGRLPAPSSGSARHPRDGAVPGEHEQIENRITRGAGRRERNCLAVAGRHGSFLNAPPRRLMNTRTTPAWSTNAASGTPSPSRSAQTNPRARAGGGEQIARGERAVAVVAQHHRRRVARREHEIEIAVGVDVGGPHPVRRRAKHRRGQLRPRRHVAEPPASVCRSRHSPPARRGQIGAEVVVEIGGGQPSGSGVATARVSAPVAGRSRGGVPRVEPTASPPRRSPDYPRR